MDRATKLLSLAAKQAEEMSPPMGGDFLRDNDVTAKECRELSHTISVALGALVYALENDKDLSSIIFLAGSAQLAEVPAETTAQMMSNLRAEHLERELSKLRDAAKRGVLTT